MTEATELRRQLRSQIEFGNEEKVIFPFLKRPYRDALTCREKPGNELPGYFRLYRWDSCGHG